MFAAQGRVAIPVVEQGPQPESSFIKSADECWRGGKPFADAHGLMRRRLLSKALPQESGLLLSKGLSKT